MAHPSIEKYFRRGDPVPEPNLIVTFMEPVPPFCAGETAGIEGGRARRLVAVGAARFYRTEDIPEPPADTEARPEPKAPEPPAPVHARRGRKPRS